MKTFSYCQSHIEGNKKCKIQCDHCKDYYQPLEEDMKSKPIIEQMVPLMDEISYLQLKMDIAIKKLSALSLK